MANPATPQPSPSDEAIQKKLQSGLGKWFALKSSKNTIKGVSPHICDINLMYQEPSFHVRCACRRLTLSKLTLRFLDRFA